MNKLSGVKRKLAILVLANLMWLILPIAATAQNDNRMEGIMGERPEKRKIGGHAGVVFPVVSRGGGTTTIADDFVFGFPMGITFKNKRRVAFDMEVIPTFNLNSPGRDFTFTVHPGVLVAFRKKYAAGIRAAYDFGAGSYGFTPLVSRGFKIKGNTGFFVEADFPVRWRKRADGSRFASGGFAAHFGVSF